MDSEDGGPAPGRLPTTGDQTPAGEVFAIGGLTLVAAGMHLCNRRRRAGKPRA